MVTNAVTLLLTDISPVLVIKSAFSLLPLGRYSFVRYRLSLVTILVLDIVMIH